MKKTYSMSLTEIDWIISPSWLAKLTCNPTSVIHPLARSALAHKNYVLTAIWYGYLAYNEEEFKKIKVAKEAGRGGDKKKSKK